jgi:hypothetical protein
MGCGHNCLGLLPGFIHTALKYSLGFCPTVALSLSNDFLGLDLGRLETGLSLAMSGLQPAS